MLRNFTPMLTACAMAATVNLFAQEPAPAPQEKQAAAKETISGCVAEARTTDGGTVYVLNNVDGGSAAMYLLGGSSQSEWAANVNKKVEMTGPVQQPSPPAEDAAAANPKAVRPPTVQVESMKMIADSCK